MPIPTVLPEFRPDQPATTVSDALKQAIHTMDKARHCAVLWFSDIMTRDLYRDLGYPSIQLYAHKELGFSMTRTGDYIRMARKLDDLPAVKRSLATGKLGYTKAREIIKVATPATEKTWVQLAQKTSRRQLEQKVARVRSRATVKRRNPDQVELLPLDKSEGQLATEVPVRVQLEMTPEQFARYEALLEKIAKQGTVGNLLDHILAVPNTLIRPVTKPGQLKSNSSANMSATSTPTPKSIPRGTPFQVHVHQCPDCGRFSVPTSHGDLPLGTADTGRILCDARIDDPCGGPNRHTIAPSVRRRVLARDGHRCQTPGCTNTRFLEVHHRIPRAKGGSNHAQNLVTLCSACHRHMHRNDVPAGGRTDTDKTRSMGNK